MTPSSPPGTLYHRLREGILTGRYAPGELVFEGTLAQEYGLSKTPVREALQLLAARGLVTVLPKKGYMVRTMDFQDVREIMDLRMLLEPHAVEAAARACAPAVIGELRRFLDEQSRLRNRPLEAMGQAQQFHLTLARAGGNGRAFDVLRQVLDETSRAHHVLPALQSYMSTEQEQAEHEKIFTAVEAGDAEAAGELMRAHLKNINAEMRSASMASEGSLWG
ncbi:GntR family transcriptional regulator [Arthrobacter sp. JSM 101049]|uniref:GntR family transcriptional regulator n=1 Tax=Arthrobacter sp. JSM 101049 TaxID=929097 RepID=UPI00356499D2